MKYLLETRETILSLRILYQ